MDIIADKTITLSKLLQVEDQQKQQELLTELLTKSNTNFRGYLSEIENGILDKLIDKVSINNFEKWFELSMKMLSHQQCFEYASYHNSSPLLKFIDNIGKLTIKQKYLKIEQLINRNLSLEKSLVFHTFYWKYCTVDVEEKQIAKFIAIFIRLSSFIVQNFLKLKHQPIKGCDDRLEDDKVMLEKCQGWVAKNVQNFFNKLTPPTQLIPRKIVLLAIGDIIGALIETNRQNIINRNITEKLLQTSLFGYCKKNYPWNEIHQLFLSALTHKHFSNPIKKIQIPEVYLQRNLFTPGLNTQAYAYIMLHYIKNSLDIISSFNTLISVLGLVITQLLPRPYEMKVEALTLFQNTVKASQKIYIKNGFEGGYPIQIVLFGLYHFENEVFKTIRNCFIFDNSEIEINSLLVLKGIQIQNLSKKKDQYILQRLTELTEINDKIYVILSKFNFKDQKQNIKALLLKICSKLKQKNKKLSNKLANQWKNQVDSNDANIKENLENLLA